MNDIKAIKAAAEAATPGPWHYGTFHKLLITDADNYKHYPIAEINGAALPWKSTAESERAYKNAAHIATANPATVIALCDEVERLRAIEESRNKGWAVAKSLQAQVSILLPVVEVAADDDDEYGIGPKARKALEALAAHKET